MSFGEVFKMNCKQATLLCQKKAEQSLGVSEKIGIWLHMLRCSLCRMFVKQSDLISREVLEMNKSTKVRRNFSLTAEAKAKMIDNLNEKFDDHG